MKNRGEITILIPVKITKKHLTSKELTNHKYLNYCIRFEET